MKLTRRKVLTALSMGIAGATLFSATLTSQAADSNLKEGQQYTTLERPMPVDQPAKIEVLEFFSYGCPHCADLEPQLESWLKTLPNDVAFHRIPVSFGPAYENLARFYYTLEALGKSELSPKIFDAYHKQRINLANPSVAQDWVQKQGIKESDYKSTYNSFDIDIKVKSGKQAEQDYKVTAVPMLVVQGKYVPKLEAFPNYGAMLEATTALIDKARKEEKK